MTFPLFTKYLKKEYNGTLFNPALSKRHSPPSPIKNLWFLIATGKAGGNSPTANLRRGAPLLTVADKSL
jgi:hypothetical protein